MPEPATTNILFIAYQFPPRGGVGVQRSTKFARYLPDFGYRPLVLTAAEEEIEFAMDRSLLEQLGDTTIIRCRGYERFLVRLPKKLRLNRLVTFWIRPDRNRLAWVPMAKRCAIDLAEQYPISAIYTSVGPYSSALLGQQLRKRLGVPWVLDYRDPWVDDAAWRIWPTKLHYWFETAQERRALETADAVVVATPTMKDLLVGRYPQWSDKIHVICNGFDPADYPREHAAPTDGRLRIGFAGMLREHNLHAIGKDHGRIASLWLRLFAYRNGNTDLSTGSPLYLLRAVRALLDERPELENGILLSFAGLFGDENLKLITELGLEKVVSVKGYVPHVEANRLLMESDVLFFPLMSPSDGRRSYVHGGKAFEYLGTRKPVLAAVPHGDPRDLIEQARAGWCVDPHDVGAIKTLLAEMIERKAAGTLRTEPDEQFIRQFERRELTRRLASLFDSLLGAPSTAENLATQ